VPVRYFSVDSDGKISFNYKQGSEFGARELSYEDSLTKTPEELGGYFGFNKIEKNSGPLSFIEDCSTPFYICKDKYYNDGIVCCKTKNVTIGRINLLLSVEPEGFNDPL
jgi:hypothetical protein